MKCFTIQFNHCYINLVIKSKPDFVILFPFLEGLVPAVQEDAATVEVSSAYTAANQGFKIETTVDGEQLDTILATEAERFVRIYDVYHAANV